VPSLDEREGQSGERGRRKRHAPHVEAAPCGVGALAHDSRCHEQCAEDDRHVDQEHRAPADGLDQRASQQRTGGQRDAADSRPDADGPGLFAGLREGVGDDGERPREQ